MHHDPASHHATSLKLFAMGLGHLHDPNWTGGDLFDEIKQHLRGSREPKELLRKPLEEGLPFLLGGWVFDRYFSLEFDPSHFDDLDPEEKAWFLEDLVALLDFHDAPLPPPLEARVDRILEELEHLYDDDERRYWQFLEELDEPSDDDDGMSEFAELYFDIYHACEADLLRIRPSYAADFGDRVLHDRQLCAYIAELVVAIGFDGDRDDGQGPRRWVERPYWPSYVKRMLHARDRGKCSQCGSDLDRELEGDPHIDHIIPLAAGGSNDIVNLQILCAACNLEKSASDAPVSSSVPGYIRRRSGDLGS